MAERKFTTLPTRAIGDTDLTSLDLRVLACVSLHDGMSLLNGKGAGCYVSNVNLAALVGCDYTSLSKALSRLCDEERSGGPYIVKERQADDKRMTTYRVRFPSADGWRDGQLSAHPAKGAKSADIVGEVAKQSGEIVGRADLGSGGNLRQTASHYIPLKGELDSVETKELDSAEAARLTSRHDFSALFSPDNGGSKAQGLGEEEGVPADGAQMAMFERAFRAGGYKDKPQLLLQWIQFLERVTEDDPGGSPNGGRARRLLDDALEALPEDTYRSWQEEAVSPAIIYPVEAMVGEPDAIRQQVAAFYTQANKPRRDALAKSAGLPPADLRGFVEGRVSLPIGKQMALRTAARAAA
jgi:hypothetical protein